MAAVQAYFMVYITVCEIDGRAREDSREGQCWYMCLVIDEYACQGRGFCCACTFSTVVRGILAAFGSGPCQLIGTQRPHSTVKMPNLHWIFKAPLGRESDNETKQLAK